MEANIIDLIAFLFPGFVAIILFKALTETREIDRLELVVYALCLTVAGNFLTEIIVGKQIDYAIDISELKQGSISGSIINIEAVIYSTLFSMVIAVTFSLLYSYGLIFAVLQKLKLTKKTGRINVWHDVFTEFRGQWVEVVYRDGKRILGWPQFYSTHEESFELFVADATWLLPVVETESDTQGTPSGKVENFQLSGWIRSDVDGPGTYIRGNSDDIVAINVLRGRDQDG